MFFRKILALFCCIAILFVGAGCSSSNSDARIYFELPDYPSTLDPQTASSVTELLLVRNLYEGLLRENSDGKIVCGVAEEYSKKGLVYTFKLKKDATWYTGDKLTADDFVFAFRRAVSPDTKSPFASRFFTIENAEAIYNGSLYADSLSVKAIGKHTLQITLCKEDPSFEKKLTTAPFMPCNQKFFEECVGKYGLSKAYVLSNGSYYLRKWNTESFGMRLYKNAEYKGDFAAKNGALFISHNENSSAADELLEQNVDATMISATQIDKVTKSGFLTDSVENICWVLSFGGNINEDMKKAFALSLNKEYFSSALPRSFRVADSFFPSIISADLDASYPNNYNIESAKETFSNAIQQTEDKRFPSTTLYYYGEEYMKDTVTSIVGHWQKTLSAFINISAVESSDALIPQLTDKTLQMAVFPVVANSDSFEEYSRIFGKSSGSVAQINDELLKDTSLIPLAFEKTVLAYTSELSNIKIDDGNGYIDFSQVTKAK